MAEDINKTMLVGRLTRDAELSYTKSGYAVCKLSVATNRRKKQGDQWTDEANFFDVTIWGKRGESLTPYLTKGTQVALEGSLKQERWEQDGAKRSKVTIEAQNIQLLGGKSDGQPKQQGYSKPAQQPQQNFNGYTPPSQPSQQYDDDVPF